MLSIYCLLNICGNYAIRTKIDGGRTTDRQSLLKRSSAPKKSACILMSTSDRVYDIVYDIFALPHFFKIKFLPHIQLKSFSLLFSTIFTSFNDKSSNFLPQLSKNLYTSTEKYSALSS